MPAGRPRTPTNVLSLKGSLKHNPDRGRARANEPKILAGIGEPPTNLPEAVRACWVELVLLCPDGVLSVNDRPFMEYAARIFAIIRQDGPMDMKAAVRFEACIGKLGMSPADRSKVSVIKPGEQKSPYDEF